MCTDLALKSAFSLHIACVVKSKLLHAEYHFPPLITVSQSSDIQTIFDSTQ